MSLQSSNNGAESQTVRKIAPARKSCLLARVENPGTDLNSSSLRLKDRFSKRACSGQSRHFCLYHNAMHNLTGNKAWNKLTLTNRGIFIQNGKPYVLGPLPDIPPQWSDGFVCGVAELHVNNTLDDIEMLKSNDVIPKDKDISIELLVDVIKKLVKKQVPSTETLEDIEDLKARRVIPRDAEISIDFLISRLKEFGKTKPFILHTPASLPYEIGSESPSKKRSEHDFMIQMKPKRPALAQMPNNIMNIHSRRTKETKVGREYIAAGVTVTSMPQFTFSDILPPYKSPMDIISVGSELKRCLIPNLQNRTDFSMLTQLQRKELKKLASIFDKSLPVVYSDMIHFLVNEVDKPSLLQIAIRDISQGLSDPKQYHNMLFDVLLDECSASVRRIHEITTKSFYKSKPKSGCDATDIIEQTVFGHAISPVAYVDVIKGVNPNLWKLVSALVPEQKGKKTNILTGKRILEIAVKWQNGANILGGIKDRSVLLKLGHTSERVLEYLSAIGECCSPKIIRKEIGQLAKFNDTRTCTILTRMINYIPCLISDNWNPIWFESHKKVDTTYTRSLASISELVFPLTKHHNLLADSGEQEKQKKVSCLLSADVLKRFFTDLCNGKAESWKFLADKSLYPQCTYEPHLHDAYALKSHAKQSSKFLDFVDLAASHLGPDSPFVNSIKKFGVLIWMFDPEFTNHFMLLLYRIWAKKIPGNWELLDYVATPPALFHFRKAGLEAHCTSPLHNAQTWRGFFQYLGYRPNFYKKQEEKYQGKRPNPNWRRVSPKHLKDTGRYHEIANPILTEDEKLVKSVYGPRVKQGSPLWHSWRVGSVGGSAFGNLLGLSEKESCKIIEKELEERGINYDLKGDHKRMLRDWERLTGEYVETEDEFQQLCFAWGHAHEDNGKLLWLLHYPYKTMSETGMHFLNSESLPSNYPRPAFAIHASPDGLTDDAVIEVKSKVPFYKGVNEFHYNGHKRYPDSIVTPVHYAQVQLEMLCTGKEKAYLVIVSPRNGATMFTIYKDDGWLAQAIKWIIWWHERYVSGAQKIRLPRVDNKVYHNIEGHSDFLRLTARNCATAMATKVSIADVPYTEAEHQPMFLGDEIAEVPPIFLGDEIANADEEGSDEVVMSLAANATGIIENVDQFMRHAADGSDDIEENGTDDEFDTVELSATSAIEVQKATLATGDIQGKEMFANTEEQWGIILDATKLKEKKMVTKDVLKKYCAEISTLVSGSKQELLQRVFDHRKFGYLQEKRKRGRGKVTKGDKTLKINYEQLKYFADLFMESFDFARTDLELTILNHYRNVKSKETATIAEAIAYLCKESESFRYYWLTRTDYLAIWVHPFHEVIREGNYHAFVEALPKQIIYLCHSGNYKIARTGLAYLNSIIYWSENRPGLLAFISAHCKTIYDKYIERYNSLLSRYLDRNYRVTIEDIQKASQIVLEVDKFVKRLEKEVKDCKETADGTHIPLDNQVSDKRLHILEGKSYKVTIERVGEWHKQILKDVLEKKIVYKFEDQWEDGRSQINKQIDDYERYLLNSVKDKKGGGKHRCSGTKDIMGEGEDKCGEVEAAVGHQDAV